MKQSGNNQLSARYVSALFDVAQTANVINQVEGDLLKLTQFANQSTDFADFIANPLMNNEQKTAVMMAIADGLALNATTKQFLSVLCARKRLPSLASIAELFSLKAQESRGEMGAMLVSAAKISTDEVQAVAERLSKIYGKKILIDTAENADLIGGLLIKIGSRQLDASLAGKLERLKNALKAA